jgi:hypothetical protein
VAGAWRTDTRSHRKSHQAAPHYCPAATPSLLGNRVRMYSLALSGESNRCWDRCEQRNHLLQLFRFPSISKRPVPGSSGKHYTDRFVLHNLRFRVDTSARSITKSVANHLGKVEHEFVVIVELIDFDTDNRSII